MPPLRTQTGSFLFLYSHTGMCVPLLFLLSWFVTLANSSLDTLLSLGWIHPPIQAVFNSERNITLQSPSASMWPH